MKIIYKKIFKFNSLESILNKFLPTTLFPDSSSLGEYTQIPHLPGTTPKIAPLTPLFDGIPTSNKS